MTAGTSEQGSLHVCACACAYMCICGMCIRACVCGTVHSVQGMHAVQYPVACGVLSTIAVPCVMFYEYRSTWIHAAHFIISTSHRPLTLLLVSPLHCQLNALVAYNRALVLLHQAHECVHQYLVLCTLLYKPLSFCRISSLCVCAADACCAMSHL